MPRYYPASLRLEGRRCVVVGGGSVAARRAAGLLDAGAEVLVVAPTVSPEIEGWAAEGALRWRRELYGRSALDGAFLVVAATSDGAVNAAVTADAREAGVLCNDADQPERGDVIVPSVVRRGDLTLTVTAGGSSPFLAARVRRELEERYGPEYAYYAALLGEVRKETLERIADSPARRAALRALADDEAILDLIREGRADEARARAFQCICSLSD